MAFSIDDAHVSSCHDSAANVSLSTAASSGHVKSFTGSDHCEDIDLAMKTLAASDQTTTAYPDCAISLDDIWKESPLLRANVVSSVAVHLSRHHSIGAASHDGDWRSMLSSPHARNSLHQLPADSRPVQLVICEQIQLMCVLAAVPGKEWRAVLSHLHPADVVQQPCQTDQQHELIHQMSVMESECSCYDLSCPLLKGAAKNACEVSADDVSCPVHRRLLQLLATAADQRAEISICVEKRTCLPLILRLLHACSRLHGQLHLSLDSTRQLRTWNVQDTSCAGATATTGAVGGDDGILSNITRLQIISRDSACLDMVSIGMLFPHVQQLDIGRWIAADYCAPEATYNRVADRRCVCKYRANGGAIVLLPSLKSARLQQLCTQATAAIRAAAKSLHTLCLLQCRLEAPPQQLTVAPSSGSRQSRSFRDIIDSVLRRRRVAMPNIQIRNLSVVDGRVNVALINSNFPCLKQLHIESMDDRCSGRGSEGVPEGRSVSPMPWVSDGAPSEHQPPFTPSGISLWFPSLEYVRLTYRSSSSVMMCGDGECSNDGGQPGLLCGDSSDQVVRLNRLVEYVQHFGRISLHCLSVHCPNLLRLTLDPVLLSPTLDVQMQSVRCCDDHSAEVPWTFSKLERFVFSWCDPVLLAAVTSRMPALRSVSILDPSVSEKTAWSHVVETLHQRGIEVSLQW